MKCSTCDEDHEVLEPSFRRPDPVVGMPEGERGSRVKESDDLCAIWARAEGDHHRYFVRGILPIRLLDSPEGSAWGLWVEVAEPDFHVVVEKWSDPQQADLPAMQASLANTVPGYPDMIGLPANVRLTGPNTRPEIAFDALSIHPFVVECRNGVCVHRVAEWLAGGK
jgi:hypothetical protein